MRTETVENKSHNRARYHPAIALPLAELLTRTQRPNPTTPHVPDAQLNDGDEIRNRREQPPGLHRDKRHALPRGATTAAKDQGWQLLAPAASRIVGIETCDLGQRLRRLRIRLNQRGFHGTNDLGRAVTRRVPRRHFTTDAWERGGPVDQRQATLPGPSARPLHLLSSLNTMRQSSRADGPRAGETAERRGLL